MHLFQQKQMHFLHIVYDNSVWVTKLHEWKYNDPEQKEVS